jgi:cell division protein FtsZ
VVIGTSLDPDMTDEIRVTVVATGIGTEKKPEITLVTGNAQKATPAQPVTPTAQPAAAKQEEKQAQPLHANNLHKESEVKPQPASKPAASSAPASSNAAPKQDKESGYLDIPAFLRRQAD